MQDAEHPDVTEINWKVTRNTLLNSTQRDTKHLHAISKFDCIRKLHVTYSLTDPDISFVRRFDSNLSHLPNHQVAV